MANTYTGTSSQWMSSNKAYEELLSETEKYKNYFLEPTAAYSQEVASATQAANYDISQAYANYKKQQLSLLSNKALATGFKEDVSSDLKSAYESSRYKTESELGSKLDILGQKYQKELENRYGVMGEEAKKLSQIERGLYEFINQGKEAKDQILESDLEKLGYYKQGELDEYGRPVYEITDEGRALLEEAMYGADRIGEKSYYNYLRENYGDELADYYLENQGTVNELIAGLPSEQRSVSGKYSITPLEYKKELQQSRKERSGNIKAILNDVELDKAGNNTLTYKDAYGNSKTININIKDKIQTLLDDNVYEAYGIQVTDTMRKQAYDLSHSLYNLDKTPKKGDVVEYDNNYYVYYKDDIWYRLPKNIDIKE